MVIPNCDCKYRTRPTVPSAAPSRLTMTRVTSLAGVQELDLMEKTQFDLLWASVNLAWDRDLGMVLI